MGNPGAPRLGAEPWRRGGASRSYPRRSRCGSRSASIASPHPITPASHTVPGRLQPPRPGQATGAPCRLSDPARALWAPWVTIQWLNHAVGRNSFPYADGPPQRVDSPDGDVGESSRKRSWRVAVKPQGSRRRNGLRPQWRRLRLAGTGGDGQGRRVRGRPRSLGLGGERGCQSWEARDGERGPPGRTRLQQGSAPPIAPERCPSGRGEATVVGRGMSSRGPGGRSPSRTRRPPRAHADGGGSCEPGPAPARAPAQPPWTLERLSDPKSGPLDPPHPGPHRRGRACAPPTASFHCPHPLSRLVPQGLGTSPVPCLLHGWPWAPRGRLARGPGEWQGETVVAGARPPRGVGFSLSSWG